MTDNKIKTNHRLPIHYSQNYLVSDTLIRKIVRLSTITNTDMVMDIGAGKGKITKALLQIGCQVLAVELDKENIKYLKNQFSKETNCMLLQKDIIQMEVPKGEYKIFSNIPFFITIAIIDKFTKDTNPPTAMYIVMQKEAAEKYTNKNKTTLKSLLCKPTFTITIIYSFSRHDFCPKPKVETVLLCFQKHKETIFTPLEYEQYCDFICYCFVNPTIFYKRLFSYQQRKELKKRYGLLPDKPSAIEYHHWLILFDCFLQYVTHEKKKQTQGYYNRYLLQGASIKKRHRGKR